MADRNVMERPAPLPEKIEKRLAMLAEMGEFAPEDVAYCRRSYWSARAAWHTILVDSYETAQARRRGTNAQLATGAPAGGAP